MNYLSPTHHHGARVPDCRRPKPEQEAVTYEHLEWGEMERDGDNYMSYLVQLVSE